MLFDIGAKNQVCSLYTFSQMLDEPHLQYSQQAIFFTRQGQILSLAHFIQVQGIGKHLGAFNSSIIIINQQRAANYF